MASTKTSADEMKALREDMNQLRSDVSGLLKSLKGESGEKLSDVRQRMEASMHEKAKTIQDKAHAVGENVNHAASQAKQTAEEHPFSTAIIALCVGLITGAMIKGHKS